MASSVEVADSRTLITAALLGWNKKRIAVRALDGFLAPTGRFAATANDNVGSGYWTHAISSGQTFYLKGKSLALSAYQMYEVNTTQNGTGIHLGDTFDLDYSLARTVVFSSCFRIMQIGVVGYELRQITAKTRPAITPDQSRERYVVNAIEFASGVTLPRRNINLG